MRGIVDRIENNIVVCEIDGKEMIHLNISCFSSIPHDGDVFDYDGERAFIQIEETILRKKDVQSLFDKLKK